jgi:hypothetical protein
VSTGHWDSTGQTDVLCRATEKEVPLQRACVYTEELKVVDTNTRMREYK